MELSSKPQALASNASAAAIQESRFPILIWVTLVYLATLAMQLLSADIAWLALLFFSGLTALQMSIYWQASALIVGRPWMYFAVQGLIVYGSAYLVPLGAPAVLCGLFAVLIAQAVGLWHLRWKAAVLSVGCYTLFLTGLAGTGWTSEMVILIPIFILMQVVVVSYSILYFRQVQARSRTQSFLRELEETHRKVEELTVANERQRMARDLHDTLAQDLAGLRMQLDAADAHLQAGTVERARQIIRQSMEHVKHALSEARLVIDDLRSEQVEEMGFGELVESVVGRMVAPEDTRVSLDIPSGIRLPRLMKEHGAYILGEAVSNAVKHADASRIEVIARELSGEGLQLEVTDDGKGFDPQQADRQVGHYGLVGIRERVRLLGGEMTIASNRDSGTSLIIQLPIGKGDDNGAIDTHR